MELRIHGVRGGEMLRLGGRASLRAGGGGMAMDRDISHWSFPPAAGGAASHGAVLPVGSQVLLCPASCCEHEGKVMVYPPG